MGGLKTSSKSSVVITIAQQTSGAPIPTFIYTAEAVREKWKKSFIPKSIHISFFNKHDCVLAFSMEFELRKIVIDLQKISQWFSYDAYLQGGS